MVSCLMTSTTDSGESSSSGRPQPVTILPKRVYCYGSDMGGVDFHADERARIGDDAQSGLRTAATFRIFFLD